MTTIQIKAIAESIADIDFNGITVKTPSTIPISGMTECPYLAPRPDNFITDILLTREAFGSDGNEPMNLVYTAHWNYYHAPIGTVLSFQDYADMLENLAYILAKFADNDAPDGAVDLQVQTVPGIAQVPDAAGNYFHGAEISLRVLEYING